MMYHGAGTQTLHCRLMPLLHWLIVFILQNFACMLDASKPLPQDVNTATNWWNRTFSFSKCKKKSSAE